MAINIGQDLSDREFGQFYVGLINDTLNLKISPETESFGFNELELMLSERFDEIKELQKDMSVEEILAQGQKTRSLNSNDYCVLNQNLLTVLVSHQGFKKMGKRYSNGFASNTTEIPFLVLRDINEDFNQKNTMHKAQHILYKILGKNSQIIVSSELIYEDGLDFYMYKNELLSTLAEEVSPFGYTYKKLIGKVREETDYVRDSRIAINDMFPVIVKHAEKKGLTHFDFMKGVFFAKNFEELAENILKTAKGLEIGINYFDELKYEGMMREYLIIQ